jgi:hypothetical protein
MGEPLKFDVRFVPKVEGKEKLLVLKIDSLWKYIRRTTTQKYEAKHNLSLLCNVHTFLVLPCIIFLLRVVRNLIKFSQSGSAFVPNYLATVKIYQAKLYVM